MLCSDWPLRLNKERQIGHLKVFGWRRLRDFFTVFFSCCLWLVKHKAFLVDDLNFKFSLNLKYSRIMFKAKENFCIISVDGTCFVVTNLSLGHSSLSIKVTPNFLGSYQRIKSSCMKVIYAGYYSTVWCLNLLLKENDIYLIVCC